MSPLPDAPPPDKSRVYREFASKTALPGATSAITADLIDNFKNSLYLDEFSEDELRRLLLIQMVTGTGSVSGPMADSGKIVTTNVTDASTLDIFKPSPGEVWKLEGISFGRTSGTGTSVYTMYLSDGSNDVYWFYAGSSDGAVAFSSDSNFPDFPLYLTDSLYLTGRATNVTDGDWKVGVTRMR